ncbi:MAG: YodC family protein [Proteobacteria bacterium]|nr:YodC family protein [Pseudomonadota bacterium]
MTMNPGDVVMLKSGGQPLTVASVSAEEAVCLWIGEEGDLFREAIPLVALAHIDMEDDGGDEEDEEDEEDEDAEGVVDEDEDEAETRREREPA